VPSSSVSSSNYLPVVLSFTEGFLFFGNSRCHIIHAISIYGRQSVLKLGPGSVVGIATAYALDGPGIESRWRRDFQHMPRPTLRPTQPPVQLVLGLSRGKVRPRRDADPSPPSSAEVKNRVELYLYSP
jgi:hypothetical protein